MKTTKTLAMLSLAATVGIAHADDIRPGLWKITLESGVAATPDWKPQPFESTQCLTASDAKNPAGLLLGTGSGEVTGCDFHNEKATGNSLSFEVSCAGTLGIRGAGQVNYTATTLDGVLNVNMGGAESIDMQNKIHASYLGDCPAAKAGGL